MTIKRIWDLLYANSLNCTVCKVIFQNNHISLENSIYTDSTIRNALSNMCIECKKTIPWITEIICDQCGRYQACPDCKLRSQTSIWMTRSAVKFDHNMKEWLHRYKFQGEEHFNGLCGAMLKPAVEQLTVRYLLKYKPIAYAKWKQSKRRPIHWLQQQHLNIWDAIVPIPITDERMRVRGFNQAERMATAVSQFCDVPVVPLLIRTKQGLSQSQRNKRDRVEGAMEQYGVDPFEWNSFLAKLVDNKKINIIIIDDVYTTGSTVNACARLIQEYSSIPVVIACATWARS